MYNVGQIIYTVYQDKFKIVPLKIVEIVNRQREDGTSNEFFVAIPSRKEEKVINLKKLKNVFISIDAVKKYLIENAEKSINDMISSAVEIEEEFFPKQQDEFPENVTPDFVHDLKNDSEQLNETIECNNSLNKVKIDLGDGIVGNINTENLEAVIGGANIESS